MHSHKTTVFNGFGGTASHRTTRPLITGRNGVIASGHHLASLAGVRMLASGGNAVDAAVAAGLALTVLKPHSNGMGGECPILIYSPVEREVVSICGQGRAPRNMTLDWFRSKGIRTIPGDGFLGATVPGLFGAYCTALRRYGRLSLEQVLGPAIEYAEDGFPVYEGLFTPIKNAAARFREEWPSSAEIYLRQGEPIAVGSILRQPALARTFGRIAGMERSARHRGRTEAIAFAENRFYTGEIADAILAFSRNTPVRDAKGAFNTALLEKSDFQAHTTAVESPVSCSYKSYRVYKCGPWTQGPVFLHQLKLLEGFDLTSLGHNSGKYIHTLVECAKRAFADRERYYGDPEFVQVPLDRLLSDEYNRRLRATIDPERADLDEDGNCPLLSDGDGNYVGDTTHLDVIDREGFMVSATPSGGWIPSSPVIPDLGFPLGTRAQVFSLEDQHPNGLAPGKRPRITLTPSIAFRDGKPWIAFGTPGGDMQDQWTLQFFLNVVEFGMDLQSAIDRPNFHTTHLVNSFFPKNFGRGKVFVENDIGAEAIEELKSRGHDVTPVDARSNGEVCAVAWSRTGCIEGAAASKTDQQSYALGW